MFVKGLDDDERLMGLAFLDVMLYVTSIKVFKNLILLSDLVKSVWFIAFQVRYSYWCPSTTSRSRAEEDNRNIHTSLLFLVKTSNLSLWSQGIS